MKKIEKKARVVGISLLLMLLCGLPILFLVGGSLKGNDELNYLLAPILVSSGNEMRWTLFPQFPTLRHYLGVMFDTPEFWVLFWNSVKIVGMVLIGQACVSIPAAWGLAKYKFRGNRLIFRIYILLMLLPFQAKMLSEYLVLDKLKLINTQWSVILPGIFSTFPVFVIYQFFRGIPQEILESARLDGASEWSVFLKIGIPIAKNGIVAAAILSFIEYWNMIEQPLIFIKNKRIWPLSMYMPEISKTQIGSSFAKIVVTTLPVFILFLLGQEQMQQGIDIMVHKEKE